jgi:glycerol-3-phosphate acyltransferase PlsY
MHYFISYLFLAYIICAIPFGVIFAKILGKNDLRKTGSGNIGATNAFRTGGKALGILTFLADFFKGYFFVAAVPYFFPGGLQEILSSITAFTCVVAHIISYSIIPFLKHTLSYLLFLKKTNYKKMGGKGVATAFGTLLAINPILFGLAIGFWLLGFYITKTSGIAAMISFLMLSVVIIFFDNVNLLIKFYCFIIFIVIISTHLKNLKQYISHKNN